MKIKESRHELESQESIDFLKKVRDQYPELVGKFRSIIINKGLVTAQEKFQLIDKDELATQAKQQKIQNELLEKQKLIKEIKLKINEYGLTKTEMNTKLYNLGKLESKIEAYIRSTVNHPWVEVNFKINFDNLNKLHSINTNKSLKYLNNINTYFSKFCYYIQIRIHIKIANDSMSLPYYSTSYDLVYSTDKKDFVLHKPGRPSVEYESDFDKIYEIIIDNYHEFEDKNFKFKMKLK